MTTEPHPPPGDRLTLPLLSVGVCLGWALSAPPANPPDAIRYPWLVANVAGFLAGALYWHPYRSLGFTAPALTAATAGVLAALMWGWCDVTGVVVGAATGIAVGATVTRRGAGPFADWPDTWAHVVLLTATVPPLVIGPLLVNSGHAAPDTVRTAYTTGAAVVLGLAALFAWVRLFRPAFELGAEPVLWVMYRVRATGPGLSAFPTRGPCVVVANHACWLDPVFLAKVLPRPVTPMMTSKFYDVPVLRRLMHAFGVIRVPEAAVKHDPAELREAVAALDRGECVLIFPEGYMRRSEEKPLKRFGRGVWQILRERPDTPVFACWIEGNWGSYCSYFGGKPTKNKRPDRRRPIGVGVSAPVVVGAATLGGHLPTRVFLMNRVIEARKHLGLPEFAAFELPQKADDEKDDGG